GDAVIAPSTTKRLLEHLVTPKRATPSAENDGDLAALATLTAREREVLEAMAAGLSNAEIAAKLFVSATTVKTHVGKVLTKLGARDRVQAVVFAYRIGLGSCCGPDANGGYGATQRLERKRFGQPTPCKTRHGRHDSVTDNRWSSDGLIVGDYLFHRLFFITHICGWYRTDRHRRGVFSVQCVQRRRRNSAIIQTIPDTLLAA